jgi:hypothetical protein
VPGRRAATTWIQARTAAMARAMARNCNDATGRSGVQGGPGGKTLRLSVRPGSPMCSSGTIHRTGFPQVGTHHPLEFGCQLLRLGEAAIVVHPPPVNSGVGGVHQKLRREARGFRPPVEHPGADLWTPSAMSLPAFNRIESPGKRLRELSNGTHLPLEQPARDELQEEVAGFLAAVRG